MTEENQTDAGSKKRRTYYRIRRVAAAELERLHAQGIGIHKDAMEWVKIALQDSDDVGGRAPVVPRLEITALLAKYPTTGLTIKAVADHFGQPEKPIGAALYLLRKQGQVQSVRHIGCLYYFPSKAAADAQRERILRERKDHENAVERKRYAVRKADRAVKAAPPRDEIAPSAPVVTKKERPELAKKPAFSIAAKDTKPRKMQRACSVSVATRSERARQAPERVQVEIIGLEAAVEAARKKPAVSYADHRYAVTGPVADGFASMGVGRYLEPQ